MTLRRVPAPRLSAHGARAASPLPHMRCDGREATPPRRVSSATFGGTALKDTFPLQSVLVCSHGGCSCTSQPLVALPQTPFPGALQVE